MLSRPEPACLLIADISGYTSYLAGAELDHAQDILADLMTTVVGSLRPTFRLAKLEGDAAFAYFIAETIDGSRSSTPSSGRYFAFRRRLRDIAQATACQCNACVLMPRLDLKVVTHHGSVIRHRIAGREELVGSDVIVVHRLLKNHVVEALGMPAYALFSERLHRRVGRRSRRARHDASRRGVRRPRTRWWAGSTTLVRRGPPSSIGSGSSSRTRTPGTSWKTSRQHRATWSGRT